MRLVLQAGRVINRVSKALRAGVGFPAVTGWFEMLCSHMSYWGTGGDESVCGAEKVDLDD